MTKEEYRSYFIYWKKYIVFSSLLDEVGIPRTNFSQFVTGSNNNALSIKKLERIKRRMEEQFRNLEHFQIKDKE